MASKLALAMTVTIAIGAPATAIAGDGKTHALHGLFCRAETQVIEAFDRMDAGVGIHAAVQLGNHDEVACVYADRIEYVVVRPFIIGSLRHQGNAFIRYEATLVGVRVGGSLRPVEPAVRIFFAQPDRLPDAIVIGGA